MRIITWTTLVTLALLSAAVGFASPASNAAVRDGAEGADDRAAARALDAIPTPIGAAIDKVRDRRRTYTIEQSANAVLSFYRARLPESGWTERSVARARSTTSSDVVSGEAGAADTSAENGVGGTADASNGDTGGGQPSSAGAIRGHWTSATGRLRLQIREAALGAPQTTGLVVRQSTFVLAVTPRS